MKVVPTASQGGAAAQVPGAASPRRGCPTRTWPAAGPRPASPPLSLPHPPLSPTPLHLPCTRPLSLSSHLLHLRWSQWLFAYKSFAGSAAQSSVLWISRFFEVAQLTFGGESKLGRPCVLFTCAGVVISGLSVSKWLLAAGWPSLLKEVMGLLPRSLLRTGRRSSTGLCFSLFLQLQWGQGGCGVPPTYAHVFAHMHAPTGGHTALWEGS